MRTVLVLIAAAATLGLAACGEKPQTATAKKVDAKPWEGSQTAFAAQGWKAGDATSWEDQMRSRAQGQNEYSRSAPAKP